MLKKVISTLLFLSSILLSPCASQSNDNKIGVFKFIECEGGLGGAMHISLAAPDTGETYLMTAYHDNEGNICNMKSVALVKVAYKIENISGNYIFIKNIPFKRSIKNR